MGHQGAAGCTVSWLLFLGLLAPLFQIKADKRISGMKSLERTDPSDEFPMMNPTVSIAILNFTSW